MSAPRLSLVLAVALCVAATPLAQLEGDRRVDELGPPGLTESDDSRIAEANGFFHIVWYEDDVITGRDLYHSRSADGGLTWSTPARIDQDPGVGDQEDPVVMAEDEIVVIAWLDDRVVSGEDDVIARVSTNSGASFGAEIMVSGSMASDGGDADVLVGVMSLPDIHFAFEDDIVDMAGSNEDVYVVSSNDSGATFQEPQAVNRPPGGLGTSDIDSPSLAMSGSNVHVIWVDARNSVADHVYYNVSTDDGGTFGAMDVLLDSSLPLTDAGATYLTASGDNVFAAWHDDRDDASGAVDKLYFNASTNAGTSWLGDQRVDSADPAADMGAVSLAANGDLCWIAWTDDRNDLFDFHDVFLNTADVSGGSLVIGSDQRMDTGSAPGATDNFRPRLALQGSYVFLQFLDTKKDPSGSNVSPYMRVSTDGTTFSPEFDVAPGVTAFDDAEDAEFVVSDSLQLVATWCDNRNSVGMNRPDDVFANPGCIRMSTVAFRNAGTNPSSFTSGPAILGGTLTGSVDLTTTGHSFAVLVGYATPLTLPLGGGQTILVNVTDPGGELLAQPLTPGPTAMFSIPIPIDLPLCTVTGASTQAIHLGGVSPFALSNAQDVMLGF